VDCGKLSANHKRIRHLSCLFYYDETAYVYLVTLLEPTHRKIIRVSSERPSTISQQSASTREVDIDELASYYQTRPTSTRL